MLMRTTSLPPDHWEAAVSTEAATAAVAAAATAAVAVAATACDPLLFTLFSK